jgi:hypothetical protein
LLHAEIDLGILPQTSPPLHSELVVQIQGAIVTQSGFLARKPLAPSHSGSYFVGTNIPVPISQLLITLLQEAQLFPPYTLPEPYLLTAYPVSQVLIP